MPHESVPQSVATRTTMLRLTACGCMFVFGMILLLMGSLLPSLQFSYARAGNLGAFPLAGVLAATIVVGPLLDTWGVKPALGLALALVAGGLAVLPAVHSYAGLAASALAYGLGGGLLNTATNALVSDLSASGRGAALNLLGFAFSAGAISAPLLMSSLGQVSPWAALRWLAGGAALILVPVLVLRFPPPHQAHAGVRTLLQALNQPVVWLLGLLLFFESGSENCMFVWSGKIMAGLLGASPQRANLALLGLGGSLGAGRLAAALWLRWVRGRQAIVLSAAAAAAGAVLVYQRMGLAWMLAGFAVLGLGMSAIFPTALGLAGDRFPRETGTVFGAIMTVALVGGTAGPILGGLARVLIVPITAAAMIAVLAGTLGGERLKAAPAGAWREEARA